MQYEWKIVFISDVEQVGKNNLDKRTVVLEEINDREIKWWVTFDLVGDKVIMIDAFKVWDSVKALLNFRVSEYNGRYFTNISAWRIDAISNTTKQDVVDDFDDLPFN